MEIQIIEGSANQFGGYRLDGVEHTGEEFEELVDQAKEMACSIGRSVIECLSLII